jgi:hypothetical protein
LTTISQAISRPPAWTRQPFDRRAMARTGAFSRIVAPACRAAFAKFCSKAFVSKSRASGSRKPAAATPGLISGQTSATSRAASHTTFAVLPASANSRSSWGSPSSPAYTRPLLRADSGPAENPGGGVSKNARLMPVRTRISGGP